MSLPLEATVRMPVPRAAHELIEAVERLHPIVRAHSRAVAVIAARVARMLGVDEESVHLAASVHDVGKLAISRSVLEKPGPLSRSEWELVRRHPAEGERLLRPALAHRPEVLTAVRSHHERWDGDGYPDGLREAETPLAARIIAVADAFQAMLETRPYRAPVTPAAALEEIDTHAGSQFDPACAAALRVIVRA